MKDDAVFRGKKESGRDDVLPFRSLYATGK